MKKENGKYIYSPTDLITYLDSEFASWMDHYDLEYPGQVTRDPVKEEMKILQRMGNEHEREVLAELKNTKEIVCENPPDVAATKEAMRRGDAVIYQGKLERDNFVGKADFLVKVNGDSKLGDYYYEVWDTKLAQKTKPYYLIQLLCYAEMLESIQGRYPEFVQVTLGNKSEQRFYVEDYLYYYRQVKELFLKFHSSFNINNKPEPYKSDQFGRWESHAETYLKELDHLSQVANIRRDQIRKLKAAGINTMTALATTNSNHVTKLDDEIFATLKLQARLQFQSAKLEKPLFELVSPDVNNQRRGLALLPLASPYDLSFDMESDPYTENGHEYLFGITYSDKGNLQFKDWWAYTLDEEKKTFEDFVDWIYAQWQQNPSIHIYHYNSYETNALKRLMTLYGSREFEIDELLRNEVFVDLYKIVKQSIKIGEPSYSLKNVEHLYHEKREGDVSTAADSIVYFHRWQENPDGNTWSNSDTLRKIRDYNKEDCDSTWQLLQWLRDRQKESGITYIPSDSIEEEEKAQEKKQLSDSAANRQISHKFAEQLLQEIDLENVDNNDKQKIQQQEIKKLFAYLLEYHWREARPVFWAKYERAEMTDFELYEDIACLANLTRTNSPIEPIKKSFLHEYSYDPDQDTKLGDEDNCFLASDLSPTTIEEINTESGIVKLKLGPTRSALPDNLSLIPNEYVPADTISKSVYRLVDTWHKTGNIPSALADFLTRSRPRIIGNTHGPIIKDNNNLLKETTDAICNLDNSYLCIQGPPGSGKTHTAAYAIIELLKKGKIVGITSNSHKTIYGLLKKINELAKDETSFKIKAVKSKSSKSKLDEQEKPNLSNILLTIAASKEKALNSIPDEHQLIGDTAWGFSNELAENKLDYLFIDEAGQVSLGNLVGMAASTKNIVMIGDQMQLNQPTKAVHPENSGLSILEYLLEDYATIPQDLGVFLDKTKRMHPEVCHFISKAVYEGRLHPEEHTKQHILQIPTRKTKSTYISKEAGIIYMPVEHEGNSQGSDEEAEVVKDLVHELLSCQFQNFERDKPLQPYEKVLVVAPYNMQVRKISKLIAGTGVPVGSVDKFQGLEAAVVILSMCSSTSDAAARGLDFLLDKHRINVAISRAQALAIVVGSPLLVNAKCTRVEQMELVNLFCRIMQAGAKNEEACYV